MNQVDTQSQNRVLLIASLVALYVTFSLACDPVAFRLVTVFGYSFSGSALIFPILYVLLDMMTRVGGRSLAIKFVFLFRLCDLLFTYSLFLINKFPYPAYFHHYQAFNIVFSPLPRLYWAGILGDIITSIVEVFIYYFFQKHIKSFILASFVSITIMLLCHNVPTDLISFSKIFPHTYLRVVLANFLTGLVVLAVYCCIGGVLLKLTGFRKKQLS